MAALALSVTEWAGGTSALLDFISSLAGLNVILIFVARKGPCFILDFLLEIDEYQTLTTKIYGKHDDFDLSRVNILCLCSNKPESPAYGVLLLQLIRYYRAYSGYLDFLHRGKLLTLELLWQLYRCYKKVLWVIL